MKHTAPTEKRQVMAYDQKCLDLAEYFLPQDAPETIGLAQHIQNSIELWLSNSLADTTGARGAIKEMEGNDESR